MRHRLPPGIRRLLRIGSIRAQVRRDLDDELAFHFDEAVRELVARGLTEEEARAKALQDFGDEKAYRAALERIGRGRARRQRLALRLDSARWSLRALGRSAVRHPALTVGIIVTLGLGLGANAAVYGVVDRILLRPPEHVVDAGFVRRALLERPVGPAGEPAAANSWSYPDYRTLKSHGGLEVAGYTAWEERTLGSGASAREARVAFASGELFPLLGVTPLEGRFFEVEEAAFGAAPTAVLSAEFWERAYGADPGVLGSTIDVTGVPVRIIGVAPPGFTGIDLEMIDVWLPLEATRSPTGSCVRSRRCFWMKIVARLDEATGLDAAQAEATRLVVNARAEQGGGSSERMRVLLEPVVASRGSTASPESRLALWLFGVTTVVLVIACLNVGNLLAARTTGRRRDLGVRVALGAGRARLVGQLVLESIVLSLAGGVVGLTLARWGGEIIRSTLLPDIHFVTSTTSWRVFGFTFLTALVAGALASVVPALQMIRRDLPGVASGGLPGHATGRSRLPLLLTNLQAAMSVVLLVGAGLFVRSVMELRSVDLGLDVDRLLQARLEFQAARLPDAEWNGLYEQAAERVAALPGIRSAAATSAPMGLASTGSVEIPGLDSIPALPGGGPYGRTVSAGYFETAGVRILRGRGIEDAETGKVVVVSETMARTLWPDGDALGECLLLNGQGECTTVVGVAEDAARDGFRDAPFMAYYEPVPPDHGSLYQALYVRVESDTEEAVGDVTPLLRTFSPQVRNARVHTVAELLDPQTRQWEAGALLFSFFGILAMALAAIGLYAALAFDVAQHRREIGIRATLGATKRRLLHEVLLRGARLTVFGVLAGLSLAYGIVPHARELFFEVAPRDPVVLGGVALLLAVVAAAGSLLPGVRATRVDPAISLRCE